MNILFDGDQLSAYLVPEEIADETMKLMSPRYVTKYKKNLQNINVPSHEFLKFRECKTYLIAGSSQLLR